MTSSWQACEETLGCLGSKPCRADIAADHRDDDGTIDEQPDLMRHPGGFGLLRLGTQLLDPL